MSTTEYKLAVMAANGCTAAAASTIKVRINLYMPGAFTPNEDGKNDIFRVPPGTSINLSELSIYNRWGTKIFSTGDINKGWNGNYKDTPAEAGLYIYTINATDYQGKDIHLKGTILLVR
jgi:gliding motility-associated-like protein